MSDVFHRSKVRLGLARAAAAVIALGVLLGLAGHSAAQMGTSGVRGIVTDPSGAVIPGAAIEVKNVGTGVLRTATTNNDGVYVVRQLDPGHYTVQAMHPGFATAVQPDFELFVNQDLAIDLRLSIGPSVEKVEVVGAAPVLETTNGNHHVTGLVGQPSGTGSKTREEML
jgi:hypothetical protein